MQSGEANDPFQYQTNNWHQQTMGEIGPVTYFQEAYSVPGAYPTNCAAAAPGMVDESTCSVNQTGDIQNYTLLTPTSTSHSPHSSQAEFITPHNNYIKQETYPYFGSPTDAYLQITEEPFNRHRFRYQSERGSHGGMNGERSKEVKKTHPTVRLVNFNGDPSQVSIRASLWTETNPPEPHVHKLQGKTCRADYGDCIVPLGSDMTCCFSGLGIIFTAKKQVPSILYQRKLDKLGEAAGLISDEDDKQLRLDAENDAKKLNMNSVRILFEAIQDNQVFADVMSKPIFNQRELKITRISRYAGSCRGGDEIFMFCEKVNKKDIKIRFFEIDAMGNRGTWQDFGSFTPEADVHHQVAIAFKTPKYHHTNITAPVKVRFELYRPKDSECSDSVEYTYTPEKTDDEVISRKRMRTEPHGGEDDGQYRQHPSQNFQYQGNSFQDNSGGSSGQMFPNYDAGQGQGAYGGFTYSTTDSSNESSNSSFPASSTSNPSLSPPLSTLMASSYRNPPSSATETSNDSSDSNSIQALLDFNTAPSLVTPNIGDEFDFMSYDGVGRDTRRRNTAGSSIVTLVPEVADLTMAVAEMGLTEVIDRPIEGTLSVPSIIRKRSASLVEQKDVKAIEESNTLQLFANKLATSMRQYARTGDSRAVIRPLRSLMAKQDQDGDNTLHLAIIHQSHNEYLIQQLLSVMPVAFLNNTNNLFQSPLHLAVILDKPSVVQLLLMKGANPAIQDKDGNTAVHLAVSKKRDMCLAVLLNKQAYVGRKANFDFADILNYDGFAAIHLAVHAEDENCINKLADAGANINIGDGTSGKTALHLAIERKSPVVDCLLRQIKIDVDSQDFSGDTPLHLACIQGNEESVLQLMQADANPLIENHILPEGVQESDVPRGVTPFDVAAQTNNDLIKSILAGEVPAELKRRISLSRKSSVQEVYTHDCTATQDFTSQSLTSQSNSQNSQKIHLSSTNDSGYTSGPQYEEIPEALVEKLCQLLDPPNKGWQDLVEILIGQEHVKNFEILHEESPTKGVLEHLKKQGNLTVETLRTVFEASNLPSALAIFDNY